MATLSNFQGTVMELLGIEQLEITKEKVVLTMPVTPKTHHPWGTLHGGVSVVLAETAATMGACMNIDPEKQYAVGLEINANHIRISDEKGNLICTSRCTLAIVAKK
jgi:1,4-dihydroxy-2-naphthoyl-CoA hydrolase